MIRPVSILLLLCVCTAPLTATAPANGKTSAKSHQWRLTGDRVSGNGSQAPDLLGNITWHFLRTTNSLGPISVRTWQRDGKYVPLEAVSKSMFGQPLSGAIFRSDPKTLAPFVAGVSATHSADVEWRKGELLVAPGPDHAAILAWSSPVRGTLKIEGTINNRQTCCGNNSQVNWHLERGPAPDPQVGFSSEQLAHGISDDLVDGGTSRFELHDLPVEPGDYFYLIIDARADGSGTPHHGDATAVDLVFTVQGATLPAPPTFEQDVLPLLAHHCFDCHGTETQEAGLDLQTVGKMIFGGESGSALTPGKLGTSYIWKMIESGEMPPEGTEPLSGRAKSIISRWIVGGAKTEENLSEIKPRVFVTEEDRQHWSFQLPRRAPLPLDAHPGSVSSPIDSYLLARLQTDELTFSQTASRPILARRLFFDLTGLPPTPAQTDRFLADASPDASSQLIDHLLASPRYGERWGRHWMDTVGYVDVRLYDGDATTVYANDGMWRYRDYIIQSFNADKPYDQFIEEQLAGDEMVDWRAAQEWTPEILDKVVATGYLRNIEDHTSEGQYGIERRYEVMFDMMSMVSTSLLGLTFECTRCHNHKYDPITQRDYYRLMAFFESSYNPRNWLKPQQRWVPDVGPNARTQIDKENSSIKSQVDALNAKIEELKKSGDEAAAEQLAKLTSQVTALNARKRSYGKIQALFDVPNPPISNVFRRGDCLKRGVPVTPGFPEVLTPVSAPPPKPEELAVPPETSGRRLRLARWITSRDNPMTARVIMNRLWLHHFAEGIVSTPENLGRNGAQPTHPQLLDWLAVEFQDAEWSLKRMHRVVLQSRAYQQSSRRSEQASRAELRDPDNRLLWRQNLKRLESEILRDSILAASDQLDTHSFGPPVPVTKPVSGLSMVDSAGGAHSRNRRSVYIFARRVYPLKFMELFDSPIMAINCSRRMNSTTVLQSFAQLNSDFVIRASRVAAAKLRQRVGDASASLVDAAYREILGRPPRQEERDTCLQFLDDQAANYAAQGQPQQAAHLATADLCHMLLCMNEFLYIE
ncbi:MAG: PSD1 and planctomycete cytochrome C domain-containing protein [Planctomycetota bacterium]|nr:PSD1 and planctomycete cytochrome C domain-containing protein [Planctomycetota bacterium]